MLGKSEGEGKSWHGHVTALTVAPAYRRLGVARRLMGMLEEESEAGNMYFVDLFVRQSNEQAIQMYQSMGYSIYRTVLDYYCRPPEHAYGKDQSSQRAQHRPILILLRGRYAEGFEER